LRFLYCCCLFFLLSCSARQSVLNKHLNPNNLTAQQLNIDVTRDTIITLQNGTRLIIPSGSLRTKNGTTARLVVKEALTIEQIMLAGLSTESDGKPLRSGGMLYIDKAPGEEVDIVKSISAEIPSQSADSAMQLYKGEKEDDGSINWTDPAPLHFAANPNYDSGLVLYRRHCYSCHDPIKTENEVGPALYGAEERIGSKNVLYNWVHDPESTMNCNPYFQKLYTEADEFMMHSFPQLSNQQIDMVMYYVNTIGKKEKGDYVGQKDFSYDSCAYYAELYHLLKHSYDSLQSIRSRQAFSNVNMLPDTTTVSIPAIELTNTVTNTFNEPVATSPDYYQFSIETFGWYNIDVLTGDDAKDATLNVTLSGKHAGKNETFLVIPAYKIFVQGGSTDKTNFTFKGADGKLRLKEGLDAWVFSIGESADSAQLYFGATRFTTTLQQSIDIPMQAITQQQLISSMAAFNFQGINFTVQKDHTKEQSSEIKTQLEVLFQKLQRCNCIYIPDRYTSDTASIYYSDFAN